VAQSILSDELLRQLIAVGQVDVLVGVPTLNSAATVGTVVRAVHQSFATDFLRERTVLINSDGGSSDGTPDVVRGASLREGETLIVPGALRTMHRISAPYHGLPGKGNALRTLFAAAELTQARATAQRQVQDQHHEGILTGTVTDQQGAAAGYAPRQAVFADLGGAEAAQQPGAVPGKAPQMTVGLVIPERELRLLTQVLG